MSNFFRKTLETRLRLALEATPFSGRRIQARRSHRGRMAGSAPGAFVIPLPDLTGRGLRPVYLERRSRYATVTSVRLLDPETLVCASFLEKKLYLVRFDVAAGTHRILDAISTTHRGIPVETDLADADPSGEQIALSNFHHGSLGLYRRQGDRLAFVRDLDFGLEAKVHGVRFASGDLVAVTVGSTPTGVRFYDLASTRPTIHVDLPRKTQDLALLSEREMIVLSVHGAPRRRRQTDYGSDVCRVRFDPACGRAEIERLRTFADTHFDACVLHAGRLFLTDQRNDRVEILDPDSLEIVGSVGGYDFPHGIDVRFGLLAVSNYGTNAIDLRPVSDVCSAS
jgi:hypothetical protein